MKQRAASLKLRLGIGAGMLGLVALVAAALAVFGSEQLAARIDATLAAERRIDRYSVLSTQVSSFIVVAAEAIQSELSPEDRAARLNRISEGIETTFARIRGDLETAVAEAHALGFDEQSRRATQSLGIARMEALLASTQNGLLSDTNEREKLQGYIDIFAIGFDPLLNSVITDEVRARDTIIASVGDMRRSLTLMAVAVAVATVLLVAGFYFWLIRPQFHRLDLLRAAAQKIGREDFEVSLSETKGDEIGQLFIETNRTARALAQRKSGVEQEWARLNETIAERTQELQAANAALAKTDEDRRRFFADISHELRTPLTVILMEAQLGLKGSPPEDAFETIQNRALRLNRRIDDLLRIARSETGQLELASDPFDLSEVLQEAIADTSAELDSAGMEVISETTGPIMVIGDQNWIRQVITGVIQNAIRHARSGGRIALKIATGDLHACVHVTDNGPGIAPEVQPGVFERFAQGDGKEKSEGFGIGLALAKWVIEKQGGTVAVASPVTGTARLGDAPGTKVTLCIPRGQE